MDNSFREVLDLIKDKEYASTSLFQRYIALSFPRAKRIINHLILLGCIDCEMTKNGYKVNKSRVEEIIHKNEISPVIDSELIKDLEVKSLLKSIISSIKESSSKVKSRFNTINVPSEDIMKFELAGIEFSKVIDMSEHILSQSDKIDDNDLENFINILSNALHMLNSLEGSK